MPHTLPMIISARLGHGKIHSIYWIIVWSILAYCPLATVNKCVDKPIYS